jgi:lipid A 3-O-deacylase
MLLLAQSDIPAPKNIYQNEISLVTENDNYTLQGRDGYYTNGIYLQWNRAVATENSKWFRNKPGIKKVVNGFELGQAIYNPVSYNRPLPEIQDRPFAGYLAFTFNQHIFYQNNSVLQWAASLGTIGPNSFGKNVQRWYHNVIGIYDVTGWPFQVNNEMSLNVKAAYYKSLLQTPRQQSQFNMDGFAKANVGNAFTDFTLGTTLKTGRIENLWNSSHYKARVSTVKGNKPVGKYEIYFYYEPAITFQAYNAVLQGGMFLQNKGPVTVAIKPIVFAQQFGLRYAQNRFTTALIYTNRTRQATTQQRNENFCSFQIGYRFGKVK